MRPNKSRILILEFQVDNTASTKGLPSIVYQELHLQLTPGVGTLFGDTEMALVMHVSDGGLGTLIMFLLKAVGNWHQVPELILSKKKIARNHWQRKKQQIQNGGASDFDLGADGAFEVWTIAMGCLIAT